MAAPADDVAGAARLLEEENPSRGDAGPLLSEAGKARLAELLSAYVALGDGLASDDLGPVAHEAQRLASALDALLQLPVPERPHFWHERVDAVTAMQKAAELLAAAADLAEARVAYGVFSDGLERVTADTGVPAGLERPLHRFVCGMFAEAPRRGVWLQFGDEPRNPYFGPAMRSCHREQAPLKAAGEAAEASPQHAPGGHGHHDGQSEQGGHR